jgi:hypothetical protein
VVWLGKDQRNSHVPDRSVAPVGSAMQIHDNEGRNGEELKMKKERDEE